MYHDVLGKFLTMARVLQAPQWSPSDFTVAQRAVNAFVSRYCSFVSIFRREDVPKEDRALMSTSFPKLHLLAHIPNAVFDFGNKNQFSAGVRLESLDLVFDSKARPPLFAMLIPVSLWSASPLRLCAQHGMNLLSRSISTWYSTVHVAT